MAAWSIYGWPSKTKLTCRGAIAELGVTEVIRRQRLELAIEATPAFLRRLGELEDHGESGLFERHPGDYSVVLALGGRGLRFGEEGR